MAVKIKLKNSTVKDKAPQPTDLEIGEVAINANVDSPAAYIKDSAGNIVKIAGKGAIGGTPATESAAGIVELATAAETTAGTDATRAVHPAGLKVELDKKAVDAPDGTADGTIQYVRQVVTAGTSGTPTNTKTWAKADHFWSRKTEGTGADAHTALSPSTTGDKVQISAGTEALPGLTPVGDPNTGVYSPGADQVAISTNGVGRLFVSKSGKVGVGLPSPGDYSPAVTQFSVGNTAGNGGINIVSNPANSGIIRFADGTAGNEAFRGRFEYNHTDDSMVIATAGNEKIRVDSSGRLLVGTSSGLQDATLVLQGSSSSPTVSSVLRICRGEATPSNNTTLGAVHYGDSSQTNAASISAVCDGGTWISGSSQPTRLVFSTTADGDSTSTERMRIGSEGAINSYVEYFDVRSSKAADALALFGVRNNATSTSNGTRVFQVMGDGDAENANNSYAGISDVKLKENIVEAGSQWDDIKALQVRKYNFKAETGYGTHTQIGLVAQEVELISPGLVGESIDEETGKSTKNVNYSVLYMKAVKALQEAMERIETLEGKVKALEVK